MPITQHQQEHYATFPPFIVIPLQQKKKLPYASLHSTERLSIYSETAAALQKAKTESQTKPNKRPTTTLRLRFCLPRTVFNLVCFTFGAVRRGRHSMPNLASSMPSSSLSLRSSPSSSPSPSLLSFIRFVGFAAHEVVKQIVGVDTFIILCMSVCLIVRLSLCLSACLSQFHPHSSQSQSCSHTANSLLSSSILSLSIFFTASLTLRVCVCVYA